MSINSPFELVTTEDLESIPGVKAARTTGYGLVEIRLNAWTIFDRGVVPKIQRMLYHMAPVGIGFTYRCLCLDMTGRANK